MTSMSPFIVASMRSGVVLNGTIAAQTPTGWRIVSQSTAVATFSSTRPCMVCGIAVAHSTLTFAETTSAVNGTGKGKAVGQVDWEYKGNSALR